MLVSIMYGADCITLRKFWSLFSVNVFETTVGINLPVSTNVDQRYSTPSLHLMSKTDSSFSIVDGTEKKCEGTFGKPHDLDSS
jgi:hypothetical protein